MTTDGFQKSGLPNVERDTKETSLTIKDKWFFVDVPIFNSRVFCFVGSREKMKETAYAGIASFNQEDGAECTKFVEDYVDRNGPEYNETGDSFGKYGNCYIRISTMYVGALHDMLVLNHECLHVANAILQEIGLEDGQNKEGLCYTHQFIFGELMKQMMASKGFEPVSNPHKN